MSRAVDVDRDIARADADGRFAAAVRSLDHARPTGSQDHRGGVMIHQLVGALNGQLGEAADHALGQPRRLGGPGHHPDRLRGAVLGRRVRGDDDRVAGLDTDQDLEDRGRGRVGGWGQRNDHPDRPADLDDLVHLIAAQHTAGGHVLDGVPHPLGSELVLQPLVRGVPETGLVVGQLAQPFGFTHGCGDHRLTDLVDLLLRGELERPHGLPRTDCQIARLLDRPQVGVHSRLAHRITP